MINSTLKVVKVDQFSSDNVNSNGQGILAIVSAGQTTNIDLKMLDDNFVTGGTLRTLNAAFGDSVKCQVIDKDNILGYGANTILGQYYNSWYMRSDSQEQVNETLTYPAKILANLYIRIVYTSIGNTDVQVTANYRLHKALY